MNSPSRPTVPACKTCGRPVAAPGETYRLTRAYCSAKCQQRAAERRRAGRPIADADQEAGVCARCHGPLTADGRTPRPGQRFCSRRCQHAAAVRRHRGLPEGDRLVSGDDLSTKINELSGQVRTLEVDLSAALDRAARADSYRADADRVAREAADTVSGHADTVVRRTERADTLAAELSALTAQLAAAHQRIATLSAERDQADAKARALSVQMSAVRTPRGQGVRKQLTVAAQTYAYVVALATAWRDYLSQHSGMNEVEWTRQRDLNKYRENVKDNTVNLDTYAMFLFNDYTQLFLNVQKQGRKVPAFLPECVAWRKKLNTLFKLPAQPPTKKTYKFPATFPQKGATQS